jgi:lycopene cyclase domain-containing protein
MTYFQFHLIFIFPVLALLYWTLPRPLGGRFAVGEWAVRLHAWLLPLVAVIYTTPWDNYLVYRGIWGYPDERVLFRVGYVPFEEYLYFVLMSLLTTLLALRFFHTQPPRTGPEARWVGILVCLGLSLAGMVMLFSGNRWLYMGLVLAYFAPVLLIHWVFGGDLIWAMRRPAFLTIAVSTLYLWFTDWFAITKAGIWQISETYTSGLKVAGLELEEMAFFLIVNIVIVQSFTLLCHPTSHRRLGELRGRLQRVR